MIVSLLNFSKAGSTKNKKFILSQITVACFIFNLENRILVDRCFLALETCNNESKKCFIYLFFALIFPFFPISWVGKSTTLYSYNLFTAAKRQDPAGMSHIYVRLPLTVFFILLHLTDVTKFEVARQLRHLSLQK